MPIFWLVSTSFKPHDEWARLSTGLGITAQPTLQNYRIVFAPEAAREFAAKQSGSLDYKVAGSAWSAFRGLRGGLYPGDLLLRAVRYVRGLVDRPVSRPAAAAYPFQLLTLRMFPPIAVVVPIVALFSRAAPVGYLQTSA